MKVPWSVYSEIMKRSLDGELDGASDADKAAGVRRVIDASSVLASLVILQPLPVIDAALVAPIQFRMVDAIGRIRGYVVDRKTRGTIFDAIKLRLVKLNGALALVKALPFVPVVPELFGMSMAYAATAAVGEVSDDYFRGGRTMDGAGMGACFDLSFREQYERTLSQKRNEWRDRWRTMWRRGSPGAEAPSLPAPTAAEDRP
jgi:uncharacterized protein (DUF697 family)